jgi:hypothetical protein
VPFSFLDDACGTAGAISADLPHFALSQSTFPFSSSVFLDAILTTQQLLQTQDSPQKLRVLLCFSTTIAVPKVYQMKPATPDLLSWFIKQTPGTTELQVRAPP